MERWQLPSTSFCWAHGWPTKTRLQFARITFTLLVSVSNFVSAIIGIEYSRGDVVEGDNAFASLHASCFSLLSSLGSTWAVLFDECSCFLRCCVSMLLIVDRYLHVVPDLKQYYSRAMFCRFLLIPNDNKHSVYVLTRYLSEDIGYVSCNKEFKRSTRFIELLQ